MIESQYLMLIFKSKRSTIGIIGAFVLETIGPVYFLQKVSCINLNIYINQVFE